MVGVQDAGLAIAVGRAGGLGSLPAAATTADTLRAQLHQVAEAGLPINVNFFCHTPPIPDAEREAAWRGAMAPYYTAYGIDQSTVEAGAGRQPFSAQWADVIEPFRPRVVSFHFGLPDAALIRRVKLWGGTVLGNATTVDEALWLQERGADAIIVQGSEAGGHRGMFLTDDIHTQMPLACLLPAIRKHTDGSLIAAGGIRTAAQVRAAMSLGADAVQVGSAYLCADEATTSPLHRDALMADPVLPTALTRLFTGRPARGIVNRLMSDLGPMSHLAPDFPLATAALAPLRKAAEAVGCADFTSMWTGQSGIPCAALSAARITADLVRGFE